MNSCFGHILLGKISLFYVTVNYLLLLLVVLQLFLIIDISHKTKKNVRETLFIYLLLHNSFFYIMGKHLICLFPILYKLKP